MINGIDLSTENINLFLKILFTNVFYPFIVIFLFLTLVSVIISLANDEDYEERLRRYTAAFIPLVILAFLLVSNKGYETTVSTVLDSVNNGIKVFIGITTGVLLLEAGKQLSKIDLGVGKSLYILFLSIIVHFFLFCFMKSVMTSTQTILLGFILGGGLYIVFRGLPFRDNVRTADTKAKLKK